MKKLPFMMLAFCLATPAFAQSTQTSADLANTAHYRHAYQSMTTLPEWVTRAAATSSPAETLKQNGKTYLVGHLCKPHDCADNQLDVVFSDKDKATWGLLSRRYGKTLYQMPLGEPDADTLAALTASYNKNNPDDQVK
ncbi:Ivy family c-type lysozyme inhibitor [Acetobacter persici]|uniref:Ivy family c-type lysozyme inhibitor n=1 Tax=Acetobacter persici TaxID=1076596 RepID=UPI0036DE4CD6